MSLPLSGLIRITLFPSPIGAYYFSIKDNEWNMETAFVSVPYRGLLFLNFMTKKKVDLFQAFPSPIGAYYFSIYGLQ